MDLDEAATAFRELVSVIRTLRTPGIGCPWDLEQDHRTLRPYLIEEAYEVLDAIDRNDDRGLCEELGDLLLQVVLHAQIADDRGAFSIAEVARDIAAKMVRRHPHVFGGVLVNGSAEVLRNWEKIKAAEKAARGGTTTAADALASVPEALPALLRAQRLGQKAARTQGGADAPTGVQEALSTLETSPDREHALGEILFGICQLARRLGVNAEDSLRAANRRFVESVRRSGEEQ
jgi:MazG family protein